jgi:hypothetical protein
VDGFSSLEEAVDVGVGLQKFLPQSDDDDAAREFLGRVVAKMEEMRPWPEPYIRRLAPSEWQNFPSVPVARISEPYPQVEPLASELFYPSEQRDDQKVLVLRLRSGGELALVGPWWLDSTDAAVLFRGSDQSSREVLSEWLKFTELESEDITIFE